MEEKKQKNKKSEQKKPVKRKILIVLLVILLVIGICAAYAYYLFIWLGEHEPVVETETTNTDAIYTEEEMQKALSKYEGLDALGFNGNYEENSFVIPGLKATRTLKSDKSKHTSVCTSMTPQGICVAENYYLISAYCHAKEHNSVIYVIDKDSHEFVKEIVLKGRPHVGGLAYDTIHKNIWVACHSNGTAYVNFFKMTDLEQYSLDTEIKPLDFQEEYPIYSIPRSSFIYYMDGGLYVGYFSPSKKDEMRTIQKFWIEDDGTLQLFDNPAYGEKGAIGKEKKLILPADIASIDANCQGMALYENLILISESRGVFKSKLQMFNNAIGMNETVMRLENDKAMMEFILPPQLEQLYVHDGELYLLFESGSYAYRSWPTVAVDRVIKVDISDFAETL